jgi:hypothetical protein
VQELGARQRQLDGKRAALEAQIAALRAEFEAVAGEASMVRSQNEASERKILEGRAAAAKRRGADTIQTSTTRKRK